MRASLLLCANFGRPTEASRRAPEKRRTRADSSEARGLGAARLGSARICLRLHNATPARRAMNQIGRAADSVGCEWGPFGSTSRPPRVNNAAAAAEAYQARASAPQVRALVERAPRRLPFAISPILDSAPAPEPPRARPLAARGHRKPNPPAPSRRLIRPGSARDSGWLGAASIQLFFRYSISRRRPAVCCSVGRRGTSVSSPPAAFIYLAPVAGASSVGRACPVAN